MISLVRQRLHNRRLFKVLGPKTRRRPGLVVRELDGGAVGEEKLHHVQTAVHDGPRQRREAEEAVAGIDVRLELQQDLDRRLRIGERRQEVQQGAATAVLVVDVRVGAGLEEDAQQLRVAAGAEQRPEADVFWIDAVMQCQPQRLGGFLRPLGIGDIDGGQGQLRVLVQDGRKGDDVAPQARQ